MTAKSKLATCVAFLIFLGGGIAIHKTIWLGVPFWRGQEVFDWQIEAKVSFFATSQKKVHVRMALPQIPDTDGIGGSSGSLGYKHYIDKGLDRDTAVWTTKGREGPQSLYFWARVADSGNGNLHEIARVSLRA